MPHIIVSGKLFEEFTSQGIVAFRESTTVLPSFNTTPPARYKGPKIPLTLWREILTFFQWSYNTTKSEVQVRLFRHRKTGEWKAWALPQEKGSGMTTKEIEHPNREADMKQFAEYDNVGTVHHHCAMGAFQSGTDKSDEANQPGFHITVGHMDKQVYDLHTRIIVTVPGELDKEGKVVRAAQTFQFESVLTDWFELPEPIRKVIPEQFQGSVLDSFLKGAADVTKEKFPDRWKENLIERPPIAPAAGAYGNWSGVPRSITEHSQMHLDSLRPPAQRPASTGLANGGRGIIQNTTIPANPILNNWGSYCDYGS